MSSTTFTDYSTPIVADWLNDVNTAVYTLVPNIATKANSDGSNATGTWSINTSGNAATATNATNATNATSAPTLANNLVRATDLQAQAVTAFTTGGTATAFTLTPAPAITANAANQRFRITFHTAAGATPTLAVSGLTAKNLKYKDSSGTKQAITSVQVPSGWVSDVEYDGTDWVVLSVASQTKPAFSAYKNATQTAIVTSTYTKVTWPVEEFDTNNNFTSDRFTPTVAGKYLISAQIMWNVNNTGSSFLIAIYKNGSQVRATRFIAVNNITTGSNIITGVFDANGTTDYFEIYAFQDTGSNKDILGNSVDTNFSGVLVS